MSQAQDTELFQIQPDTPPAAPAAEGSHAWPIGSYAPMGFYRPVPIVRFAGTVLLQFLLNLVLYDLLVLLPWTYTIGACTLLALVVGWRAWHIWLGRASTAWKLATVVALALYLLFIAFVTLAPD